MRHRVQKKKLNRDMDHRKSLQRNLSRSLILNGSVETTLAKAKFVQPYIEKLVTKAKRGNDFTNLNRVHARLRSTEALRILFSDVSKTFTTRKGGYTRIVKLGYRKGDHAPMARLEWVEVPGRKKKVKKEEVKENDVVQTEKTSSEKIEKTEKTTKSTKKKISKKSTTKKIEKKVETKEN